MFRKSSLLLAAAAALAFAPLAAAGSGNTVSVMGSSPDDRGGYTTKRIVVSYADLDVSGEAGASALLERIKSAAVRICGTDGHGYTLRRKQANCQARTIDKAVASMESPQLTRLAAEAKN